MWGCHDNGKNTNLLFFKILIISDFICIFRIFGWGIFCFRLTGHDFNRRNLIFGMYGRHDMCNKMEIGPLNKLGKKLNFNYFLFFCNILKFRHPGAIQLGVVLVHNEFQNKYVFITQQNLNF